MNFIVITICLAYTVLASLEEDRQQWIDFKGKHGKLYQNQQEEKMRFSIFQQNIRKIQEHNKDYEAGKTTYTKQVNQFADLTKEEFTSMLTHRSTRSSLGRTSIYQQPSSATVPESLDWREKGAVSNVKDQGTCRSCWAFSTIGTLEGFNYLKNNKLVSLSTQQLIDCSKENYGCHGGDEGPALKYVKENGIQSDYSYPSEIKEGSCRLNKSAIDLRIKDFVQIERGNEDDLLSAVGLLGPISVALDATPLDFYKEGIITSTDCEQTATNHAVLAVGYGKDEKTGLDYWLIKNSWGPTWGENGYFRIKRGSNECAIAWDCVYPIL